MRAFRELILFLLLLLLIYIISDGILVLDRSNIILKLMCWSEHSWNSLGLRLKNLSVHAIDYEPQLIIRFGLLLLSCCPLSFQLNLVLHIKL